MSNFRRRLIMAAIAAIRSCFGNGFWNNSAAWSNSEGWVN